MAPTHSKDESVGVLPLWYVVQTKPTDEYRVETNLAHQDIRVFLPQYESYPYAGSNPVRKIRPLFSSYLFAWFDLDLHYYDVKWTRGVKKILGNGNRPVPVPEDVIQAIRARMGEDNLVRMEEDFNEGDCVYVTSGPLKDLRGIFLRKMSDRGRVSILLNTIATGVPTQISRWQIKKVA